MDINARRHYVESILKKSNNEYAYHLPKKIYKYVSFTKDDDLNRKKIKSLEDEQVYLSTPLNFNDPFDCQLNMMLINDLNEFLRLGINRKNRRKILKHKEMLNEISRDAIDFQKGICKDWEEFRSSIRICCFTESWDSFLMWSHYANAYEGICIEYDLIDFIEQNINILPVLYTDKLIATKDYLKKEDFYKDDDTLYYAGIYAILSKNSCWNYEMEWRIVDFVNKENEHTYKSVPKANAIYFGSKIDKAIKDHIIKVSKICKIENLYDVELSKTSYALAKKRIY